jgi:O-phosphoseryl-tRNA synthetase
LKEKDRDTPYTFTAFKGKFNKKQIALDVFKDEAGKKLLGPAGLNRIFVHDGGIVAFAPEKLDAKVREKAVDTGLDFLAAMCAFVAAKAEDAVESGEKEFEYVFEIAKGPSDVNIAIPEHVNRFITSRNRKIDFRGPIFFGVRFRQG